MGTTAFVIAALSFVVAVVAAVIAWLSWRAAVRSADAAEDANHESQTPHVTAVSSGRLEAPGLPVTVTCDRDLNEMVLQLVTKPLDEERGMFDHLFSQGWETKARRRSSQELVIGDVIAGEPVTIHAGFSTAVARTPASGRVVLRCLCTVGGKEPWVVVANTGLVELRGY